jgi:hypothetical protein
MLTLLCQQVALLGEPMKHHLLRLIVQDARVHLSRAASEVEPVMGALKMVFALIQEAAEQIYNNKGGRDEQQDPTLVTSSPFFYAVARILAQLMFDSIHERHSPRKRRLVERACVETARAYLAFLRCAPSRDPSLTDMVACCGATFGRPRTSLKTLIGITPAPLPGITHCEVYVGKILEEGIPQSMQLFLRLDRAEEEACEDLDVIASAHGAQISLSRYPHWDARTAASTEPLLRQREWIPDYRYQAPEGRRRRPAAERDARSVPSMIPGGDLIALGRYRLVYTRATVEEGQAMTDEAPPPTRGGGVWGSWEVVPLPDEQTEVPPASPSFFLQ